MALLHVPVKFKIKKPTFGIPESSYIKDGIFETRDVVQVAMLRRLPVDHAEEVTGLEVAEPIVEQVVPEVSETTPWWELQEIAKKKGFWRIGISKDRVLELLGVKKKSL